MILGDFTTRADLLKRVINKDLDLIFKIRAERQLVLDTKEQLDRDRESILLKASSRRKENNY